VQGACLIELLLLKGTAKHMAGARNHLGRGKRLFCDNVSVNKCIERLYIVRCNQNCLRCYKCKFSISPVSNYIGPIESREEFV
jgi:hypothetical protein